MQTAQLEAFGFSRRRRAKRARRNRNGTFRRYGSRDKTSEEYSVDAGARWVGLRNIPLTRGRDGSG
eukprot:2861578-Pyramimonas_sp.AAC.1